MTTELKLPAGQTNRGALPSHAEAHAILDRARRLRAETLAALARAALHRMTRRPAAGRVPGGELGRGLGRVPRQA